MNRSALLVPVLAGGALGGLVRVAVTESFPSAEGHWPWATFIVNIVGALVIGYALESLRGARSARARLFVGSGFCGALTTFSSFQVELLDLLGDGELVIGAAYAGLSICAGVLACVIGARLAGP